MGQEMNNEHIERDLDLHAVMFLIVRSEFYPVRGMPLKKFLERVANIYPVEDGAIDKTIKGLGYEPDDIIKRNFNRE